jgi:glycosyltransferase involved in cell wall biosynthesis
MPVPEPVVSVIVPTHNPDPERLRRTLQGLAGQTMPRDGFEVILVDNASRPPVALPPAASGFANFRVVREETTGLTPARLRGIAGSRAGVLVFVDDDNVLAPGYLAVAVRILAAEPGLGALGGRVAPEFEETPPDWVRPFHGLLALRDPGDAPRRADWRGSEPRAYPDCAPIGAGLVLRRAVATGYAAALAGESARRSLDRTGAELVSGGDNDLIMHALEAGYSVGYEPALELTHLIPARRTGRAYLGALNRAIARSWVRVLALHGLQPWRPVAPATVPLRQWRAWWRTAAWQSDAAWVTWQGLCGTFEGQADLTRRPVPVKTKGQD